MLTRSRHESIQRLADAGFTLEDAYALRRISMTLHRWRELECGDGNEHGSWAIVRGRKFLDMSEETPVKKFAHDDEGKPFLEHHHYFHVKGKDYVTYSPMPDRERGALKRLAKIMARYPGFQSYVQGDPRGCALYIIPPSVVDRHPVNQPVDDYYTRGIAVYK